MSEGYEKRDVSVSAIVIGSILTILLIVVFIVLLKDYFIINKEKYIHENVLSVQSEELAKVQTADSLMLNNYKIIDKENGIYQIPIDQAMNLVVEDYAK